MENNATHPRRSIDTCQWTSSHLSVMGTVASARARFLSLARTLSLSLWADSNCPEIGRTPSLLLLLFLLLLIPLPHECSLLSLIHNILPIHPSDKVDEEHA